MTGRSREPRIGLLAATRDRSGLFRKNESVAWRAVGFLAWAMLGITVILPICWLFVYGLGLDEGKATVANFVTAFSHRNYLEPVVNSLRVSGTAASLCVLFAVPMAWLCSRTNMPGAKTIRVAVYVSFIIPPFLGAVAWVFIAGPNAGILNQALDSIIGIKPFNIFSLNSVSFVMALYLYPYIFIFTAASLDNIAGDVEEAAAILGAGVFRRAFRVTLPLAMPAILSGLLLTLLQALEMFSVPAILAVPSGHHVMTTQLLLFFQFPARPEVAAAYGLPLIFVAFSLLYARRRILGRKGFTTIAGRTGKPYQVDLGRARWLAAAFSWSIIGMATILPVAALVYMSSVQSWLQGGFDLSLDHYKWVFDSATLPIYNTLKYSVAAAALCVGLGFMVAYLNSRRPSRPHRWLEFVTTAPIAIPGVVLAIGLFAGYSRPPLLLVGTGWVLVLAFWARFMPVALQNIQPAIASIHVELEQAARSFGAGPLRALYRITVPLSGKAMISAWIFCFVLASHELSAAVLLVSVRTEVVSTIVVNLYDQSSFEKISALGMVMLVITLVAVLAGNSLVAGKWRLPGRRRL